MRSRPNCLRLLSRFLCSLDEDRPSPSRQIRAEQPNSSRAAARPCSGCALEQNDRRLTQHFPKHSKQSSKQAKGASSWVTARPLEAHHTILHKGDQLQVHADQHANCLPTSKKNHCKKSGTHRLHDPRQSMSKHRAKNVACIFCGCWATLKNPLLQDLWATKHEPPIRCVCPRMWHASVVIKSPIFVHPMWHASVVRVRPENSTCMGCHKKFYGGSPKEKQGKPQIERAVMEAHITY